MNKNKYKLSNVAVIFILAIFCNTSYATARKVQPSRNWPPLTVTEGLGISVQFRGGMDDRSATINPLSTVVLEKQIDQIVDMGFRVVRIDNHWQWKDKLKVKYDFSEHHRVVELCRKKGLRVLTILSFRDPRFELSKEWSIQTKEGRQAYADFCAQIVKEFKGQGIIWEMWNEPNSKSWVSIGGREAQVASAEAYMAAIAQAIPAMKGVDSGCIIIAPGLAGFDPVFMEVCLNKGLLDYVSAVSIHPYHLRHLGAEVNFPRYEKLKSMMSAYALRSPGKSLPPIVNSELGYTQVLSPGNFHTQEQQAVRVVRSILVAQMVGLPMHIVYTNLDYATELEHGESMFGLMTHDGQPKSAYYAVKTLTSQLDGLSYKEQLEAEAVDGSETSPDDYVAVFDGSDYSVVVAWTTAKRHKAKIQLPGILTQIVDMKGKKMSIPSDEGDPQEYTGRKILVELSGEPIYIIIDKEDVDLNN